METVCVCRGIFLILGRRYDYRWLELNTEIWPRLQVQSVSWAKMKEALNRLASAGLIITQERPVECNRRASFYRLSELGWRELRQITEKSQGEERDANTTSSCSQDGCGFSKAA